MKSTLLFLFLFSAIFANSQDSIRLLSNFERFSAEKNVLKKIESARIGLVGETSISLQKISNPGGASRMAVVLSPARTVATVPSASYALYIDHNDLNSLCKALNSFQEEAKKKEAPKNDPYYLYSTDNNIVVSLVYLSFESTVPGWYIVISQRYADSGATIPGSAVTVKTNEIDGFVLAFNNAKRIKDL